MTREVFLFMKDSFNKMIESLKLNQSLAEEEYIEKNKPYKEGEKVELYKNNKYQGDGIVGKTKIKDSTTGELETNIHKIDENGQPYRNGFWWFPFGYDKIKRKE
jgi:hypothetical protein